MRVCHLRTRERSLSEVKSRPWKFVRQFLPWTSSTRSLIFRKAWSSSFWRSARETSKMRPFRASLAFFRPVVRFTKVFPTLKYTSIGYQEQRKCAVVLSDIEGRRCLRSISDQDILRRRNNHTLTEYQSFRVKGS